MGYFPFFIDIKDKNCVIVGGGRIALQKLEKIILFNPKVTVIAPDICDEIKKYDVEIKCRKFDDSDINGAVAVISASDDEKLNAHIFELCTSQNILVNTVDDKSKCGFIFPAIVKKGDVAVGISTSGQSPLYAKYLRKKIEKIFEEINLEAIDVLSRFRPIIKECIKSGYLRKKVNEEILNLCISSDKCPDDERIFNIIENEVGGSSEN
ncbi:MAG: bifunctional precorrin-2 dehydrogenase/sirohydrochlorin ferrochelatase [Clostridiales bacterium]|nr:bifunctional precorrin-2 dehydrogenase/sirohydrochlorin ferrochelatase [Clostridiales bacterium]